VHYQEAVDYLYARLPMFTRDGASAIKKDLTNTLSLCEALGNPHQQFRSIHVAGTNGKGSTSHMLAAVLQAAGYRTGLYTSPHLLDFRERIRINGSKIPEETVADFVTCHQELIESIAPSFFEATVALAFDHFARENVDIAIIETGLGGRLDSTNVITPLLSLITNIGYDHTQILGNTLQEIATEKAGIIKPGVPVVIGEWQVEVSRVFERIAAGQGSPLTYAAQQWQVTSTAAPDNHADQIHYQYLDVRKRGDVRRITYALDLRGSYQAKNLPGVLTAIELLRTQGFRLDEEVVHKALGRVQQLTGLLGRWQTLSTRPLVICDTGHNPDGWREVLANIAATPHRQLHMILGVMRDKALDQLLPLLPVTAHYYFCAVDMPRALPAIELAAAAATRGLKGTTIPLVADALAEARRIAHPDDLIFVGGSTFVVAEALTLFNVSG